MRPLTTIILLVLTAAAVGFIAFFERRQPGTAEAAERARVLLDLPAADIAKIEITNAAGRVKLERVSGGAADAWQLTSPVKDRADAPAVAMILQLAAGTEVLERLTGDEVLKKSRLKELGLDAGQQGRVTFYPKGGGAVGVILGRPAPVPGSLYVQIEDGDRKPEEVLVVRVPWTEPLLGRSPGEWRDPRLLMAAPDRILRIAVQSPEGGIELERDQITDEERRKKLSAVWRLTQPLAARADQELVTDHLLPGLVNARALSFAEPGAPPVAAGPAAVRVTVWSEGGPEDGESLEIFAGTEPESAWVQVAGRPGQARGGSDLLALRACTLDRFRDTKLAALETRSLTTVILKDADAGETPLYLHRNTWHLAHHGLVYEASRERVQSVVEIFNSALVLQWFDEPGPPADYGLDQPLLEITFGTAPHPDRARPAAPTPADSAVLRIGQRHNRFYAQWAGQPTVMRFDGSILGLVPRVWNGYKSPHILAFAPLSLRRLTVAEDPSPPVECVYHHATGGSWTATRQGVDVSEFLNLQTLERLVNRLSEFEAHEWSADAAPGLEALRQPVLSIELVIEQFDETTHEPTLVPVRLSFAPATAGPKPARYYGRINDESEVFIVKRALLDEVSVPILNSKPSASAQ